MNAININNVTMKFGDVTALENATVSFEQNRIYGLLGRNGAGKSTLLNIITNKIFPTEGNVTIDGDIAQENDFALAKTYCMSEKNLYSDSDKIKYLFKQIKIFYKDFDMDYANMLAQKFGLNLNKSVKQLSTGYTSIFKLIIALSVNVPYILFDEPVLGLDANHRDLFYRTLIENYSENPKTIIISTHLIEEIADIVEQVIIIKEGKILLDKPTDQVKTMGYCVSGTAADIDSYIKNKQVMSISVLGGLKTACILGEKSDIPANLQVTSLDLQSLFIQMTNA